MTHVIRPTLFLAAFVLLLTPGVHAQDNDDTGCCDGTHCFDLSTLETVQGTVQRVDYITPTNGRMQNRGPGVHLLLGEGADTLTVALGPAWYVGQQGPGFQKGETVTVTGSRVTMDDAPVLIAKELKREDQTITLRDDQGLPAWRGQAPGMQGQGMGRGMQGQGMGRGMQGQGMGRGMQGQGGCRGMQHRRGQN